MIERLAIDALGTQADGIGRGPGGLAFVPFSLPGETLDIERDGSRAAIERIVTASPERREPPCPHFGQCGGCELQHASEDLYRAFKRDVVSEAFRREGVSAEIGDLVPCPPASRRRAVFSAVRADTRVLFGFHEPASHRISQIETCLVVTPVIAKRLPLFRKLATLLIDRKRELRMTVTETLSGFDVAVDDAAKLTPALRQQAVKLALDPSIARLSVSGETIVEARSPQVTIDGLPVALPPGAFLQAVPAAEEEMARVALGHLAGLKSVADLFCGVGAFALRMARTQAVHAVEFDAPALAALDGARRGVSGLKPVTLERRDLIRRPVTAKELEKFGGVLFDPPRAGAEAQCVELAKSKVQRIAAVSCNPPTLARDATILIAGGYRLLSVTPIDQFLWSHHVEAVALFER
ncbi:class I SAM-dependent RNA methyltransferase [Aureimonas pseudogalii]|uniref:23S rRNA (Uracil1939-C5)-methyltransferase n=1 Tax=Aureimonas pseudogalii TaxID=1744844 RepID=A0A7W6H5D5_9HYPH|nr:class I SAM-dependent RNA methyltransferase [Aureimonas pseudogalii]MBB3998846.1 23S rRNA (uracil1939-C5)-methyltransferase [Aureimonas pseudogalii]